MSGRWRGRVLAGFAAWLVLWIGFLWLDYDVRGFILGGVVFTVLVLWWFLQDVSLAAEATRWSDAETFDASGRTITSGSRLEHRITDGAEPHLMADETHRSLRWIVIRRLRSAHGVDLDTQPGDARAILGPEVYDYLTNPAQPAGRGFAPRMSAIVDRIELL